MGEILNLQNQPVTQLSLASRKIGKIPGKSIKPRFQDGPGPTFRRVPAILTLGFFAR
jgi:hypothetical protein